MSIHRKAGGCQRAFEVKGETQLSKAGVVTSNVVDYTMPSVLVKHLALSTVDLDSADKQAAPALPCSTEVLSCWSCAKTLQSSFEPTVEQ